MFKFLVFTAALFSTITSYPVGPEPGDLALYLDEEQFEDYLDKWLEVEQQKWLNKTNNFRGARSGCTLLVNEDFTEPQPVVIRERTNDFLHPEDNSGQVRLNTGERVTVACPGRIIDHPNVLKEVDTGTIQCVNGKYFSGADLFDGNVDFSELKCSSHPQNIAEETKERCYNNNVVIRVGYRVNNEFYPVHFSCFDKQRLEVLYVWMHMAAGNQVQQTSVARPGWKKGAFYPGIDINGLYTQKQQKKAVARIVGERLANKYVTRRQFLARGHLTAKSDHILATSQRATFFFINAAPQWQPFNGGNWNWLEQNLRAHIGTAGYNCIVYTGTFGVTQLRNEQGHYLDVYLDNTDGNQRIPVPLYVYKVAYDVDKRLGTAFISINNPYYSLAEVKSLQFCTDRCRNNHAFDWLRWKPDQVELGYSFCCTVDEFRRYVSYIPHFPVEGLLT